MIKKLTLICLLFNILLTAACVETSSRTNSNEYFVVSSSNPEPNSTDFDIYEPIELSFSRLLNKDFTEYKNEEGELESIFKLTNNTTGEVISGQIVINLWDLIFTPKAPLNWDTSYTIFVSKQIRTDAFNSTMVDDFTSTFITAPAPTAEFSGLSHSGTEANSVQPLTFKFNFKPEANINYSDLIKVYNNSTNSNVPGTAEVFPDQQSIVFTPRDGFFDYNSSFSVSLNGSISGVNGREYVTLNAGDFGVKTFSTLGPVLLAYSPNSDSAHPSPNTSKNSRRVRLQLSFNFTASDINSTHLILKNQKTGQQEALDLKTELPSSDITFLTRGPLEYGATYEVTLKNDFSSTEGSSIKLPQNFTWTFTTQTKQITSQTVYSFTSNFTLDRSINIYTNFDLSNSSFLVISGINTLDNKVTVYGEFDYNVDENGEVFNRGLTISEDELSNFKFGQSLGFRFEVYDVASGDFIDSNVFELQVDDKKVTPTNKSPYSGEINVAPDTNISFKYLEPSVLENDFALLISLNPSSFLTVTDCFGDIIAGYLQVSLNSAELTFTPDYVLESDCEHEVNINPDIPLASNNIKTEQYSWKFTTKAFKVKEVLTSPTSGPIETDSNIEVVFNENIQYYDDLGIYIETKDGFYEVPVSVYQISDTIIITPLEYFEYSTAYKLVIEYNAVSGYDGASLKYDYEFDFTTKDTPFTESVSFNVTSIDSYSFDGYTDVDSNFTVYFSSELDTFDNFGIFIDNLYDYSDVPVTVYSLYDTLVITPLVDLDTNTSYSLTIRSYAVQDLLGNSLESDFEYLFTTNSYSFSPRSKSLKNNTPAFQTESVLARSAQPSSKRLNSQITYNKKSGKRIKYKTKFQKNRRTFISN